MTVATQSSRLSDGGYIARPRPSGLADVIDLILDKGLVIDAYVRVSLVGIEILTIDLRVVIASVDTYLKFAEATNRLDLYEKGKDLPEMVEGMTEAGSKGKTGGAIQGVKKAVSGRKNNDNDNDNDEEEEQPQQSRRSGSGHNR